MFKQSRRKNNGILSGNSNLSRHSNGFHNEGSFLSMIALERKRAERTRRPFMLMLIDIGNITADENAGKALWDIHDVLQTFSRETDIKGWFRQSSVVGALFIEINVSEKNMLYARIRDELRETLSVEHFEEIEISYFVFPEGIINGNHTERDHYAKLYPDLIDKYSSMRCSLVIKRVLDVIGSVICIILFSPAFLLSFVLIKASSSGPCIFKQERVGRYGKEFKMLKLRTMFVNCDSKVHKNYIKNFISNGSHDEDTSRSEDVVYKITDDKRVTPIGKFLRKLSLDEIPQFINVLKGDMSLVGPRPPIPYEIDEYDVWHRRRITESIPGITGLWQVEGRSSTKFDDMVRLDIRYVREWSLLMDLKILLKTPMAVLKAKGAH